jgi:hypothetical protein
LQASIVPAFLQGQRRELFKGAQHLLYFHASTMILNCKGTKKTTDFTDFKDFL